MKAIGLTQAKLAEMSDCTPTQMGLFLKSEASLNRESLDKSLVAVGVNLESGVKRLELAREAAEKLKDLPLEEIRDMGKKTMVALTKIQAIECLPDPTKKEFEMMVESGIVDYEGTFPYFKALVLHFHKMGGANSTPRTVQSALESIAKGLPIAGAGMAISGIAGFMPSLIGVAIGSMLTSSVYSKAAANSWAPFLTIAKSLLKK